MRTKDGQKRHDDGVVFWANRVIVAGWSKVWVDLPNYAKPPTVGSYVPDIYAQHGDREYIIEVETADSVNTEHSLLQKAAFQKWKAAASTRKFEVREV